LQLETPSLHTYFTAPFPFSSQNQLIKKITWLGNIKERATCTVLLATVLVKSDWAGEHDTTVAPLYESLLLRRLYVLI